MNEDPLMAAATAVRRHAYAPYSGYTVGAALLDSDGGVWAGCNVENISFGLCVCAERAAVARMVAEGGREIVEVVVATADGGTPCGMCLQSMWEFAPDPSQVRIRTLNNTGPSGEYTLRELMPHAFASNAVRTKGP